MDINTKECACHVRGDFKIVIKSKLTEYAATVRKEEREAAFKEAIAAVRVELDKSRLGEFFDGSLAKAIAVIEAAAAKWREQCRELSVLAPSE